MRRHYVYIVRCADRSLYTGYASNPERRTRVHNAGRGARYTCGRRPVRLVYSESFETIGDALRREHQLKRLPKAAKEALVARAERRRTR
jgi:putative endonuclease